MPKINASKIEMLSKKPADALYEQLETGKQHTPYETETAFYSCIENGDTESLEEMIENFMSSNIVVGRMSNNDLKQMQYFAVCCVTLATRYAIKGGLSEITAFNLSDEYIQTIDGIRSIEEIPLFLSDKAIELTRLVHENGNKKLYPPIIKRAAYYIESHLYQECSPADVAAFCGISKNHLSLLFRKNTESTLGAYISAAKLKESRRLIYKGLSNSAIAYQLCFCSESYFISCYKKFFKELPGDTRKNR